MAGAATVLGSEILLSLHGLLEIFLVLRSLIVIRGS
jgi:hypothetical protein